MNKESPKQNLPARCPLCSGDIEVTHIKCNNCGSEIIGSFEPGSFTALPAEFQKFVVVFLRHRGNIKGVEKELGISYPTINKMLESINNMLAGAGEQLSLSRKEILDAIEKGEMTVQDAKFILKSRK